MMRVLKALSCSVVLLGAVVVATTVSAAANCEGLASLELPDATSITAKSFPGGTFQPPDPVGFVPTPTLPHAPPPIPNLPAFCEVSIVVEPQINIEIWLPLPGSWTNRFQGVGGGGYAGTITWTALATAVEGGYAAASTDTGHSAFAPNNGPGGGGFALNQPADTLNTGLIRDFAERSELELARKGKALIRAFYGTSPRFSYWTGCSTGGRQGWIMAQRHPEEYDGYLTGAPAFNWDRFIPAELWGQVAMKDEVGAPISPAKLNAVTNAVVAACAGHSGDGTLPTDSFLADPRLCTYKPAQMSCSAQPGNPNCLTAQEVSAVSKIWDGPRDPQGRRLWFGLDRGASLAGGLDGSFPFPIATDHFAYWLRQNPNFDWHTVTESSFSADFFKSESKFEDVIGTDSTDLGGFIEHKAKDITYHGTADQLIFSRGSINYFERLHKRYGAQSADQFARLFMVPGMGHCIGGAGANSFGNVFAGPPVSSDPQHDIFKALVDWVEFGIAPEQIIATKFINDNPASGVAFTRPLCVFPKVASYKGTGNPTDAENWACVKGVENDTTQDADAVLSDRGNRDSDDRDHD
jgi:Tannase and feruloyl esterase